MAKVKPKPTQSTKTGNNPCLYCHTKHESKMWSLTGVLYFSCPQRQIELGRVDNSAVILLLDNMPEEWKDSFGDVMKRL